MGGETDAGEKHRDQVPLYSLPPGRHKEGGVSESLSVVMSLLSLPGPAGACQAWAGGEVPGRQGEYYLKINAQVILSRL